MTEQKKTAALQESGAARADRASAYAKETLLRSKRFADRADALSVCLKDGKRYTVAEAEQALEAFMNRRVSV